MKIALGKGTEVDGQELITGRTLICSMSRYGKSFCARRICEQLFGHAGIAIIDIEGEYSTLLEAYPFFIIGRDVPIVPEAAAFLADEMLKNKLSFIIDGSNPDLDIAIFQEFVAIFVNRFIAMETQAKIPYLFVLEECTELIPEKGVGTSLCSEELTRLVAKGGKRGLGCLIITQRPAFVSKRVISQAPNKIVGRTEWPDDIAVLRKFAQIPESADIPNLKKGDFYTVGPFITKPHVMHVGPVKTTHLGATPPVIPPTPSELKDVVAQLAARVPKLIEEMKPIIPKAEEIEARIKEKFEKQWRVRLERVEKQRDTVRSRTEAKSEVEIADLKRKLDDAVRHATLKGGVSDLFAHPLVQKNLSKLNDKQRSFLELLETKGPQDSEHCSLFLETKPKNVPTFVYDINRKIPKLIENQNGRYVSRLAKLFPVTEEAQAEAKESDRLRGELATVNQALANSEAALANRSDMLHFEEDRSRELKKKLKILETTNQHLIEIAQGKSIPAEHPDDSLSDHSLEDMSLIHVPPGNASTTSVLITRTVTDAQVKDDHHVLDLNKTTWEGKVAILCLEKSSFLTDEKAALKATGIGKEIERRFNVTAASGGNLKALSERLAFLVSEGILTRIWDTHDRGWSYWRRPEFNERVRPYQEAAA